MMNTIDPLLFQAQFEAFLRFVEKETNLQFTSFASHPYTEAQENYKYKIYNEARKKLAFQNWQKSDIGGGKIAAAVISAIELADNNLVPWQPRHGKEAQPHKRLSQDLELRQTIKVEEIIFRLYKGKDDKASFEAVLEYFGKKYPLVAYLFFLKDRSKYLPIAPTYFDEVFELLGAETRTARHCSWENYSNYLKTIQDIKSLLFESISSEVTLLDAHSFAWILISQMKSSNALGDNNAYFSLNETEKAAVVQARRGQGHFREKLIQYWRECSVTGCRERSLLIASHIKPWKVSSNYERVDLYNGLLLTPALDAAFDGGFITFEDSGAIRVAQKLRTTDRDALGITEQMRLRCVEPKHCEYLDFHRTEIFQK